MSKARTIAKGGVGLLSAGLLVVVGFALWAKSAANEVMSRTYETHKVDFPIPFPLSDAEIAELRAQKLAELGDAATEDVDPLEGVDLDAIALERAIARGDHYVHAIGGCFICHGEDFGGAVMMDDPMIGVWKGPNITSGGRTKVFTASDWDRAVRHGVLPGNLTSVMPVGDFLYLSDHELSDIVAYIQSMPPKDTVQPKPSLGPLGTVLVATGKLVPDVVKYHGITEHPVEPPPAEVSVEFGRHISRLCTGCHRENFEGGPMPFGPPDWPAAMNLTPSEDGLAGWTLEDFSKTVLDGTKPDGTPLRPPMNEVPRLARNWTDTERKALFLYLQSLPPLPTGK